VIIANIFFMGADLEHEGRLLKGEVFEDMAREFTLPWFTDLLAVSEHFFTAFFAIELGLRLGADGLKYLKSMSRAADAFIVVVCSLDSWVFKPTGMDKMSGIVLLRLLRLLRLVKVFRVVRVMRVFSKLRVLVAAVITSIEALLWSMTLLFVIESSTGLLLARLLQPVIVDPNTNPEAREFLWLKFGTFVRAFLSMFELTMAPGAFMTYRLYFEHAGIMFATVVIVYTCFVTFAVIRVITAMFLKSTLAAHAADDAEQIHQLQVMAATELHKSIVRHRNESGEKDANQEQTEDVEEEWTGEVSDNAVICKEHLAEFLVMPYMSQWIQELDVSQAQAEWVFDRLDGGGSGQVHFTKYVAAILRMAGTARSVDLNIQLQQGRQVLLRLDRLERLQRKLPRETVAV
jgi:hypothetical protein